MLKMKKPSRDSISLGGFFLVRRFHSILFDSVYADDWLILCRTQREAQGALETAQRALQAIRLAINPYKTRIVNFEQGFKFVGWFFIREEMFDLTAADRRPLTAG